MQKIKFSTSMGDVVINDVNSSHIGGAYRKLGLSEFDGNSQNLILNTIKCIDMPGQRTISTVRDAKAITAKITFAPLYYEENRLICRGERGMHELRREVLRLFPLGVKGTLEYTNDTGSYLIAARLDESPKITVKEGYFCECTLIFTADYPYWSRTVSSGVYSAKADEPATIISEEWGDTESPVSGLITCTEETGASGFRLQNVNKSGRIDFYGAMKVGQQLSFSLEYNNELVVSTRYLENGSYGPWFSAYERLCYTELWPPCRNGTAPTEFLFSVLSSSGALDIELNFHNLFTAV